MVSGRKQLAMREKQPLMISSQITFNPAPRDLKLTPGEAQIFCASLPGLLSWQEYFESHLSQDEHARARRFAFQRDRSRFVIGRGLVRELLGRFLTAHPAKLVFAFGKQGKPRMAEPVNDRFLHFNLAHSGDLISLVISEQSIVGIDVEHVRPIYDVKTIVANFFSKREYASWCLLPAERQMEAFFEIWTRKEAFLKAVGAGVGLLLNQVEIPVYQPHELPRRHFVKSSACITGFFLHLLEPAPAYKLAVAISGTDALRCWNWAGV